MAKTKVQAKPNVTAKGAPKSAPRSAKTSGPAKPRASAKAKGQTDAPANAKAPAAASAAPAPASRRPMPSLGDAIQGAATALASGDVAAALGRLLEAWRERPAPALAETIERITKEALPIPPPPFEDAIEDIVERGRNVDRLRDSNAATANGLIVKLRYEHDPRVAAAAVRLFADPAWHATGSFPFWTKLGALLEANPDPRAVGKLQKIDYTGIILGRDMHGKMTGAVGRLVDKLAATRPPPAALRVSDEEKHGLAALRVTKAPRPAARPKVAESALWEAVYAAPDDDGPRGVLADYLLERGDPRGELIALQLNANPTEESAAKALAIVRKHQKGWLGGLGPFVKYLAYPSVDAIDPLGIKLWWHRGFMAGCILRITKPKLVELGSSPLFRTVERLSGIRGPKYADEKALAGLFRNLGALRHLDRTELRPLLVAADDPRLQKRLEQVTVGATADDFPKVATVLQTFGNLRKLDATVYEGATFAPVLEAGIVPRLDRLALETNSGSFELERVDGRYRATVRGGQTTLAPLADELAAAKLPIAELVFHETHDPARAAIARALPDATVRTEPRAPDME